MGGGVSVAGDGSRNGKKPFVHTQWSRVGETEDAVLVRARAQFCPYHVAVRKVRLTISLFFLHCFAVILHIDSTLLFRARS